MSIAQSICPMSVDWGNVADWCAVVTSFLVGIAVILLSRQTNRIANSSAATSASVANLQLSSETARAKERADERLLLLIAINGPVAYARAVAQAAESVSSADGWQFNFVEHAETRQQMRGLIERCRIPLADAVQQRLSMIGNPLAARIIRVQNFSSWNADLVDRCAAEQEKDRLLRYANVIRAACVNMDRDLMLIARACYEAHVASGLEIKAPN